MNTSDYNKWAALWKMQSLAFANHKLDNVGP